MIITGFYSLISELMVAVVQVVCIQLLSINLFGDAIALLFCRQTILFMQKTSQEYKEEMKLNSIGDGGKEPNIEINLESPLETAPNNLVVMGVQLEAFGSHNAISVL